MKGKRGMLACNTHNRMQVCLITQETVFACISTYSNVTGIQIKPLKMANQQFPI
jgi:hypothetical protein